ncbi:hypothetical protein PR048_033427 [Dryococelus australis]|uniref:Uncharacterized protein n=1 Tax=Dryococelus australis TaxID=614101 RepID=A0ABQ9G4F2_9NEOP|nr:hypothetical protein PR048_033427 [Dryococelus australis]
MHPIQLSSLPVALFTAPMLAVTDFPPASHFQRHLLLFWLVIYHLKPHNCPNSPLGGPTCFYNITAKIWNIPSTPSHSERDKDDQNQFDLQINAEIQLAEGLDCKNRKRVIAVACFMQKDVHILDYRLPDLPKFLCSCCLSHDYAVLFHSLVRDRSKGASAYQYTTVRSHGTHHQTTVPYKPEQNGIVKRDISMLSDKGLGKELWAEAINTAVKGVEMVGLDLTPENREIQENPHINEETEELLSEGWSTPFGGFEEDVTERETKEKRNKDLELTATEQGPESYKEAMNMYDIQDWKDAIVSELQQRVAVSLWHGAIEKPNVIVDECVILAATDNPGVANRSVAEAAITAGSINIILGTTIELRLAEKVHNYAKWLKEAAYLDHYSPSLAKKTGSYKDYTGTCYKCANAAMAGETGDPRQNRQLAALSARIPTCENLVLTPSGIEPSSSWWEARNLSAARKLDGSGNKRRPSVMMKEMWWSSLKDTRKVERLVRMYRMGGWGGLHCKLSKGVFRGRGNNSEKLQRVWRRKERGRQSMLVRLFHCGQPPHQRRHASDDAMFVTAATYEQSDVHHRIVSFRARAAHNF